MNVYLLWKSPIALVR